MNNEEPITPTSEPTPPIDPTPSPEPIIDTPTASQEQPVSNTELTNEPVQAVVPTSPNTPGVIILQWLSYAFWGWLIVALIWLMCVIFVNAIIGISVSSVIPYAIAASVVLLPIAFITDFFYRRYEPLKKTGVAMVIMVIHAVIFALLGIGALIIAVFNGLSAVIEASNTDSQMVILATSLGAALLYAITFIRTLNPFKAKKPALLYSLLMVAATTILLVFAFIGPLVQTIATKDDRRIEQNLPDVSTSINNYIQDNDALPARLGEVTIENKEAKKLVDDNLVEYTPETSLPSTYRTSTIQHRYQLCVNYKEKSEDSSYNYSSTNDYSSYVSTYGHIKGNVCYKVEKTTQKDSNGIDLKALNL